MGLLLFLTIIGNIVMIDFFYNIDGAKSMAVLLLGMGLYLFLSDWRAFWSYIFGAPYAVGTAPFPKLAHRLRWLRVALVPVLFVGAFGMIYTLKQNFMPTTPVDGAWDFGAGAQVSRLYFDGFGYCTVQMADRLTHSGECAVDTESQTISMNIKQIDVNKLLAEGKLDETTDQATFARLTADSPTAFKFDGTYSLTYKDTLVLEPEGGGEPVTLTRAQYAYGNPYRDPFATSAP